MIDSDSPLDYLVAGAAYELHGPLQSASPPKYIDSFRKRILEQLGISISEDLAVETLKKLKNLGLINVVTDKYAGTTITYQQANYDHRYLELTSTNPNSLLNKARIGGYEWIKRVLNSKLFQSDLEDQLLQNFAHIEGENAPDEVSAILDKVPASDRIVTILHNSEDGIFISSQLQQIQDDLEKNNEIAVIAGDERDTILGETKAVVEIVRSEKN